MPWIGFVAQTLKSSCAIHVSKGILAITKLSLKLLSQANFLLALCLEMTDSSSKVNILEGNLLVVSTAKARKVNSNCFSYFASVCNRVCSFF